MVDPGPTVGHLCGDRGGRNKRGGPCGKPAIAGTDRCDMHSGKTRARAVAQGQVVLEIRKWCLDEHTGRDVDPGATLLQLISYWRWKFDLLSRLLGEAYEAAERLRVEHNAARLLVLDEADTGEPVRLGERGQILPERAGLQQARRDLDRIFTQGGVAALVGNTYAATKDGDLYATGERMRGLEELAGAASDRLAKYCALALSAGIAERMVRMAEQHGSMLATVLGAVFADPELGASEAQRAVLPGLLARHVAAIGGGP